MIQVLAHDRIGCRLLAVLNLFAKNGRIKPAHGGVEVKVAIVRNWIERRRK